MVVLFEILSPSTYICRFTSSIVFRLHYFALTKERTSVDDRATPGHLHSYVLVGKGSDCHSNYIQILSSQGTRNEECRYGATSNDRGIFISCQIRPWVLRHSRHALTCICCIMIRPHVCRGYMPSAPGRDKCILRYMTVTISSRRVYGCCDCEGHAHTQWRWRLARIRGMFHDVWW